MEHREITSEFLNPASNTAMQLLHCAHSQAGRIGTEHIPVFLWALHKAWSIIEMYMSHLCQKLTASNY